MSRPPFTLFTTCLVLATCLAVLASCTTAPAATGTRAAVAVPKAPFFKYGPAQSFGPDFLLDQETKVTVLKRDWAFTRVTTDDGVTGYIASEDLKPAPPEPKPIPSPASTGSRGTLSGKSKRSYVPPTPGSPLFDMTDLPALPTEDPPKPAPNFRF